MGIIPSQLSRWYQERFGAGSRRLRKIGIVPLARKLLVDLWRFLKSGVIPEESELKAQEASEKTTITFRAGVSCPVILLGPLLGTDS